MEEMFPTSLRLALFVDRLVPAHPGLRLHPGVSGAPPDCAFIQESPAPQSAEADMVMLLDGSRRCRRTTLPDGKSSLIFGKSSLTGRRSSWDRCTSPPPSSCQMHWTTWKRSRRRRTECSRPTDKSRPACLTP
ncbi:uncharacterized protein LOC144089495 isoform X2 [Stigmatopora argus]